MLRLRMPTEPCAFICINFAHRKCGIVGLFPNFSFEIRQNLVEFFRAKTSLPVVYIIETVCIDRFRNNLLSQLPTKYLIWTHEIDSWTRLFGMIYRKS